MDQALLAVMRDVATALYLTGEERAEPKVLVFLLSLVEGLQANSDLFKCIKTKGTIWLRKWLY